MQMCWMIWLTENIEIEGLQKEKLIKKGSSSEPRKITRDIRQGDE